MNARTKAVVAGIILLVGIGAHGLLTRLRAENPGALPFLQAQATRTKSQNSMGSSCGTFLSAEARLAVRSAILLNESTLPLMRNVAEKLKDQLAEEGVFESIRVAHLQPGEVVPLEANGRGAEVFLRLKEGRLTREGLLTVKVKGEISLFMGTAPWSSNSHHSTHLSAPLVEFAWKGQLLHESEITGISTRRDELIAADLSKTLAEHVSKQIKDFQSKHEPLPPLPDSFYGKLRPVPKLEIPAAYLARQVASYPSLLTHNDTFWLVQPEGEPAAALERLAADLRTAGWKQDSFTPGESPHLRMMRGDAVFTAFLSQRWMHDDPDGKQPPPPELVLQYRESFSEKEIEAALEELCASDLPLETLLPFTRMLSQPQQALFRERVLRTPHSSAGLYMYLARGFPAEQKEKALQMLARVEALKIAHLDRENLNGKIRAEMKKLTGSEENPVLSAASFRDAGFHELRPGEKAVETTSRVGETTCFFSDGQEGPVALCVRFTAPRGRANGSLVATVASKKTCSSSKREINLMPDGSRWNAPFSEGFNDLRFQGNVQELESGGYRVTAAVEKVR